jgi:hypothetical protein
LTTPFEGWFGELTWIMAGLYLIGFAAPAFDAAACHVGETVDPNRNLPRAMLAAAAMAGVISSLSRWFGSACLVLSRSDTTSPRCLAPPSHRSSEGLRFKPMRRVGLRTIGARLRCNLDRDKGE